VHLLEPCSTKKPGGRRERSIARPMLKRLRHEIGDFRCEDVKHPTDNIRFFCT
jgi:hypothetical protein